VGNIGAGTAGVAGLAIVPESIRVVGSDIGQPPRVIVFDASTGVQKFNFLAYEATFTGGVHVAAGDVTGDGVDDIITGPGPGGGPLVRVFDGQTGLPITSPFSAFFAYDAAFRGGVNVASADVNGDGFEDILAGAGDGGGPQVEAFSGKDGSLLLSFFAYDSAFRGGVRVAGADTNLDGISEIVTSAGPGGAPHIKVFSNLTETKSFFAYDPTFRGGAFVAAGDLDGDGRPEIITGAGAGGGPQVVVSDSTSIATIRSFFAYDSSNLSGVRVAVADVNGDGRYELITGGGPGNTGQIKAFDATTLAVVAGFDAGVTGGVFVGGDRR
jgi:hypothetical protein